MLVRLTYRIARRLLAPVGAFFAFTLIPVLYLLGTSYQDKLLAGFHIDPSQAPLPFDRALYIGFKVALAQWGVPSFHYLGIFLAIVVGFYSIAAIFEAFTDASTRTAALAAASSKATIFKAKLGWLGNIVVSIILIYTVLVFIFGFVTLIGAGERQANVDIKEKKDAATRCQTKAATLPAPCVKVVHGDSSDIGVEITSTDSLLFIISGKSTMPLKTEDIKEISDVNQVAPLGSHAALPAKDKPTSLVPPPSTTPHKPMARIKRVTPKVEVRPCASPTKDGENIEPNTSSTGDP